MFAADGDFASLWDIDGQRELNRISLRRCRDTNFTHSPLCQLFDVWPTREIDLLLAQLTPPEDPCFSSSFLGFTSNREQFAVIETCNADNGNEYHYQLYQLDTLDRLKQSTLAPGFGSAVLNADGSLIFAGYARDEGLLLLDRVTAQRYIFYSRTQNLYHVQGVFAPDGNLLAVLQSEELQIYAVFDCLITSDHEVNLRSAPTTDASLERVMFPGERFGVYGSEMVDSYTWLRLANDWWVRGDVVQAQGNCPE